MDKIKFRCIFDNGEKFILSLRQISEGKIQELGTEMDAKLHKVCRCTDKTDKNGRFIYEDDVVLHLGVRRTVEWDGGQFVAVSIYKKTDWIPLVNINCRIFNAR